MFNEPATDRAIANGLTNAINKRIESLTWLVQRYKGDGNSESTRIATAYETVLEWLKADVAMYGQDEMEGEGTAIKTAPFGGHSPHQQSTTNRR